MAVQKHAHAASEAAKAQLAEKTRQAELTDRWGPSSPAGGRSSHPCLLLLRLAAVEAPDSMITGLHAVNTVPPLLLLCAAALP